MPAKRKRSNNDVSDDGETKRTKPYEAAEPDDTTHSVLGGLKGGYRVTGMEKSSLPGMVTHRIPFEGKEIICERYSGDEGSDSQMIKPELIFTHGAGGGIANPATASFVRGFSNVSSVVCFQGTMNLKSRVKTFHAVIEHEDTSRALGGRSMGARAAVITALESEESAVEALILASYPLVGAAKGDLRDSILKDLGSDVDVLFIAGTKDSMCDIGQLKKVRREMTSKSWLLEVEGADHGMSLKSKAGVEAIRKETGAIAARWLKNRSYEKTRCTVQWRQETDEVACTEWAREPAEAKAKKPRAA